MQSKTRTQEEVAQLAESIMDAMRAPLHIEGEETVLATSIGIALAARADYDQIIKTADEALCRARDAGGNVFSFYGSGFMSAGRTGDVADLARAVFRPLHASGLTG